MKKLKVGIIGYGIVGKRRRLFIDQNDNLETICVCDVRFLEDAFRKDLGKIHSNYDSIEKLSLKESVLGKLNDGVAFYSDYKQMLSENNLDMVFVCLPNYLAPEATIESLKKGCHVFCEKPPGRSVQDIVNVRKQESKNKSLKLKYGFNHRYHGSVQKAKQIIDENIFGDIINFRGVYGKSSIVPVKNEWRSLKKYSGGGILLDQGIHMLDLFRYFCGDFNEIKSFVSNNYWKHNVEDNAYAIMRDEKGRIAMIHSTATQWQHRFKLEITFENGYIELSGILSGSKSYGQEKLKIIPKELNSSVGSLKSEEINYLNDNSWNDEILDFTDIVLNNKKVVTGNSYDALKVMELVENIYKADA
ncbi:Gfo/Idh/MocA family oxidoreductase [Flavobacteriaceae bacterium]|nr:Gfo/Idh/MocA family oxidoreductase [Flavobacteriaceae bacterium]